MNNDKSLKIDALSMLISFILILIAFILSRDNDTALTITLWALAFLIGGRSKAVEGLKDTLKNRSLNVEFLMLLSALGAFTIGNYQEGAILILIFGVSGVLEEYSLSKSEKALTALLNLQPKQAIKIIDDKEVVVDVNDLRIDDVVIIKVGDQVPADGIIVKGTTALNQSAITGEFVPVNKQTNDFVMSGSINEEATIYVKVTVDPSNSMVQKIINFVAEAQTNKTKAESWIDRFEEKYVYVVLIISFLLMVVPPMVGFWDQPTAFYRGIVLLVVASPCALVASISPTMLATMSNAARKGILIKGAQPIESLSEVDFIFLDKTGTITKGLPKVMHIEIDSTLNQDEVITALYHAEKHSNHPLAKAIVQHLEREREFEIIDFQTTETPGQGVTITVKGHEYSIGRFPVRHASPIDNKAAEAITRGFTIVNIVRQELLVGYVLLMDTVRENVKETIDALHSMDVKVVMLTGDNHQTGLQIAQLVGIDEVKGNLFPEDKVKELQKLKQKGYVVMMVGDGINDSPALSAADIGLAMGSATDVSLETADIVLMNDNMKNLAEVIKLSKKAKKIALQNVFFSITVIVFLILMNVLQIVDLPLGVVFHEGSTILVILNGLRMLN